MATIKATHQVTWAHNRAEHSSFRLSDLWGRYLAFADKQKPYHTAWWVIGLVLHGAILLPLTFLLVYASNGPAIPFLTVSMVLFFTNIVSNMSGASTRFTIMALFISAAVHVLMAGFTLIVY